MTDDLLLKRLFQLESRGPRWGLSGIRRLLEWCGHPERRFPAVLVGGTNGKGSTAAVLERMLREAGFRTGLYSSPHLVRFHERIRVNGRAIAHARLAKGLRAFVPRAERHGHSFFEATTALALRHFAEEEVELAVLEVGLGGRLDSTNAVHPEVSVLAGVALDHADILGTTLDAIAREKAGIARRGRAAVVGGRGHARALLEAAAGRRGARVVRAQRVAGLALRRVALRGMDLEDGAGIRFRSALLGRHQISNLECALAAVGELEGRGFPVGPEARRRGLELARWPARFEWLPEQRVLLDVAHNPDAARAFAAAYADLMARRGVGVLGMLADKDASGVARALRPCTRLMVATEPHSARALPAAQLSRKLGACPHVIEGDVGAALERAFAERRAGEPVFVIGSLYTVGEAIPLLHHHVPTSL